MSKMKNYKQLAQDLLENVGGEENITYFMHCTTRLRFNVKNRSLVKINEIKSLNNVLGAQWSNDEIQVIIGPDVPDLYKEVSSISNLKQHEAIDENLDTNIYKKRTFKSVLTSIMDGISGSITPIIPMMIAGGMLKVAYMLANLIGILPADSSTYIVLSWVGDAFIYFFPVFLGATSAKKFGANQGLGMLLGAILIYPSFISAVNEGVSMTIFGLPIYMANYANTVIPIILAVWIMSKVESIANKYSPTIVRSFLAPLITLLVMIPITMVVAAPIGYYIGTYVAAAVAWLYNTIGFVGVAVLSAFLPLMVMTGMHTMMTPYWVTAFATNGMDPFFLPAMILSNLNIAASSLAVALKAKNQDVKSTAMSTSITAAIAGVTEPAMFGVALKYKTPLYAAMIGNAVGGLIAGIFKVASYAFPGSGGVFAIVTFFGPEPSNILWFTIAAIIGAVVTILLTFMFGFDEGEYRNE